MVRARNIAIVAGVAGGVLAAGAAGAQAPVQARAPLIDGQVAEGKGVADRPRPDYAPIGGRIGSFFLYPTLQGSFTATDNVRATNTGRLSDGYFVLGGDAKLVSNFSRHAINLDAFVNRSLHTKYSGEDVTQYGGSAGGTLNFGTDGALSLNGLAGHYAEDRTSYTSPINARAPVRFDRQYVGATVQDTLADRVEINTSLQFTNVNYADAHAFDGTLLSQQYRDIRIYGADASIAYAFRPGLSLLVRAIADKRAYVLPADSPLQPSGLDRDSSGARIEAGLKMSVTSLLYGQVRVGYLTRRYSDARLPDTSGLSFGADVLWNVDPLTTLRMTADRRIDDAASVDVAGNKVTEITATVDRELLRNLLIEGFARYARILPIGPIESSDEYGGRAGIRYLMSRRVTLRATYAFAKRTSPDPNRAFRENRGTLTAALSF